MNKWSKATEKAKKEQGADTTPCLTMNLRTVVKISGAIAIEQLIEYRNNNNMVVNTEWVELPTIYEG